MESQMIFIRTANINDTKYVNEIARETELSAISRGSGISKRSPELLIEKIKNGKAVIAVTAAGEWAGFAYLEAWENGDFVANSGLIVSPKFRNAGVARAIKERIFKMSRRLYPDAKIFSITSGAAIMKMNSSLKFEPVSFAEITHDDHFWEGCKSCVNYNILENKKKCNCLCTAMLFDPKQHKPSEKGSVEEESLMVLDCAAYSIYSALTDISWFYEYIFPIEGNLPDPVKMVVTEVKAGIPVLNSAGQCNFTVEIRYDHSYTVKEILNTIKNHTQCKFTLRPDVLDTVIVEDGQDNIPLVLNNH